MRLSTNLSLSFYVVFAFLYLFGFGIKLEGVPVGSLLGLFSGCYILATRSSQLFLRLWGREIILIVGMIAYMLCVELILGPGVTVNSFSIYIFRILFDGILPAHVLMMLANKYRITFRFLVKTLIAFCAFQLFAAIMMMTFPALKQQFFFSWLEFDQRSVVMAETISWFRGFGIASTYLAWFPYSLALIYALVLFNNEIRSRYRLFLFFLCILILIAVNARVAFVPLIISILSYLVLNRNLQIIKSFVIYSILITSLLIGLSYIDFGYEMTARVQFLISWILDKGGFLTIGSSQGVIRSGLSNYRILSNFDSVDFLFGRGSLLVPGQGELYTDEGYLQTLFTGGILLLVPLVSLFSMLIWELAKNIEKYQIKTQISKTLKCYPYLFASALLIGHYKLRILEINETTRLLLLLISIFMANSALGPAMYNHKLFVRSGKPV
jgi:hypothetical protein